MPLAGPCLNPVFREFCLEFPTQLKSELFWRNGNSLDVTRNFILGAAKLVVMAEPAYRRGLETISDEIGLFP